MAVSGVCVLGIQGKGSILIFVSSTWIGCTIITPSIKRRWKSPGEKSHSTKWECQAWKPQHQIRLYRQDPRTNQPRRNPRIHHYCQCAAENARISVFLGTNAYVQVKTCKDCGKVEKMKKEMPEKKDIHSCEHKNTNRLGSNKATMRVFCKDCGNFIDEMPREEAKRRQATGREVETMSSSMLRPGIKHSAICESGSGANYRAGSGAVGSVPNPSRGSHGSARCSRRSQPAISAEVLHGILQDCIEASQMAGEPDPLRGPTGETDWSGSASVGESSEDRIRAQTFGDSWQPLTRTSPER